MPLETPLYAIERAEAAPLMNDAALLASNAALRCRIPLAHGLLVAPPMADRSDSLTIPLLVILWTTLLVGFIMVLVVVLMK